MKEFKAHEHIQFNSLIIMTLIKFLFLFLMPALLYDTTLMSNKTNQARLLL